MDQCASVLLSFPPDEFLADNEAYDRAIKEHMARVAELSKDQGIALLQFGGDLLNILDPETNSFSYLMLLDLLSPLDPKQAQFSPVLAERTAIFLQRFDARQTRYNGAAFMALFTRVCSGHIIPPSIAVPLLADALVKIDPSGSTLTSNHLLLMKIAYFSGEIRPALRVAERPILYFPGMLNQPDSRLIQLSDMLLHSPFYMSKDTGLTTRLTPLQVLEYEWLVGLAYTSQHDWAHAVDAFARAASYPTRESGVSKVMVESYKKWVLVSLLASGRLGALGPSSTSTTPPHGPPAVNRAFNVLGRAYIRIAELFQSLDVEALRGHIETAQSQFSEDGNEGLVAEILKAHQKWQIIRLREVYSKISLADVQAKTKSAVTGEPLATEAELLELIGGMIASGMLKAEIVPTTSADGSEKPAHLSYLPVEEELSEAQVAVQIAESARKLAALGGAYKASLERFSTSKEFIKQTLKDQRREKDNKESALFEGTVEDEDLMSGVVAGD